MKYFMSGSDSGEPVLDEENSEQTEEKELVLPIVKDEHDDN